MQRIENLTREAFPLMISGAVILLYMKIDQVMLGYLSSESEVAYYVAATRLSEAWYFVGLTVLSVYFPSFLKVKAHSGLERYESELSTFFRIVLIVSFCVSALSTVLSPFIIDFLYGESYESSIYVLMISIWAIPFVLYGNLTTRIYIDNSKHERILIRSILGLLMSVFLNAIFIVFLELGSTGAALSLLITQVFSGAIFPFLDRDNQVASVARKIFGR